MTFDATIVMEPDRQQLLDSIRRMQAEYPDWRIGQIVANVATWKLGPDVSSIWEIKDEDFVAMVDEHLKKKASNKRLHEVPEDRNS